MSLWVSENAGIASEVVTRSTAGLPEGWVLSPNQRLGFSDDASRLFLGTAPAPLRKDSTLLDAAFREPRRLLIKKLPPWCLIFFYLAEIVMFLLCANLF